MDLKFPKFYDETLPIKNFITKKLIGVSADSSVQQTAQKMVEFNISSIVVIKNDKVVGFLTEGDLKKKIIAQGKSSNIPITEIMVKKLITVDINTEVKEAMNIMLDNDIKHLLVEENNQIVGILTFTNFLDIQRHKFETYISRE